MKKTFAEKIFNAYAGDIVYREPNIILSHDNSAKIEQIFRRIHGEKVYNPDKLFIVLDQKEQGQTIDLMGAYQNIHKFIQEQGITNFHDCDKGICHHVLFDYLKRGMLVVGNDAHTCTAGALNCMAIWIKKTETAHLWKYGKMWFRVPESIKINLEGELRSGVYAKDAALWIMGMLKNENIDYQCIEYHGGHSLSISDRMTIANIASEMGAVSAVFPPDDTLAGYFNDYASGIWADEDATYSKEFTIHLDEIVPLVYDLDHNQQICTTQDCQSLDIQQGILGNCSSGRIENLRVVANILKGKKIKDGFRLFIVPASRKIYLQAIKEGLVETMIYAGATVLGASCKACMGKCPEIYAEGKRLITTTNSFSLNHIYAQMDKYIASPATVAYSALNGYISPEFIYNEPYPYWINPEKAISVSEIENRRNANVWDYSDINNIKCVQLCSNDLGKNLSLNVPNSFIPHLLKTFDPNFVKNAKSGDVILGGEGFGDGPLSKFAVVGLRELGIKAIIVKSANRNFFRMAINHGLLVVIAPQIIEAYKPGDKIIVHFHLRRLYINEKEYTMPCCDKIIDEIIEKQGMIFV